MVVGTSRLSSVNIRRQPVSRQKRKFTRADPDQTRILLENYEAEARPNARQLADMSQETNLCAALITFAAPSDLLFGPALLRVLLDRLVGQSSG